MLKKLIKNLKINLISLNKLINRKIFLNKKNNKIIKKYPKKFN